MKFFLFIVLLITSTPTWAFEEESADTLGVGKKRIYSLEGIRVVADKPESSIGKIIIKDYSIRGINPDLNFGEAVTDLNGVNLTTGGKSGSNLNIRGFNEKQIKILVDGRPLSGGYFGSVDLNTIPASDLQEIQVIKGPVSSLYGSDTMGGVVNFITKKPDPDFTIKAGIIAKRNNTNKLYLTASQSLKSWDYRIYLSRYNTEGFVLSGDFIPTTFENGKVRNHNASEQYDIKTGLNWTLFDFHSFSIQSGYTTMPEKEITPSIYEKNYRKYLDWKRWQLSGAANIQLLYNLESNTNVYYDQYEDIYAEYSDPDFENMYLQWPSELSSWKFGLAHIFDWQINIFWRNQFGYRFEKEAYSRKDNGNYQDWTSNNLHKQNLFWQSELDFRQFSLTSGCAFSVFRQKHRVNWIYHFEPSLGIFYTTTKNWQFSLSYSCNTKYPTLHELFSYTNGNEDLKEEEAHKFELNWDLPFILGTLAGSISQTLYYNTIRDLIDLTQAGYENFDKVNTSGYETILNLHLGWDHELSYSYLEFAEKDNYSLLGVPRHTFRIEESLNLPLEIGLLYKGEWKDTRETEIGTSLPAYWLHNIYLSHNWDRLRVMLGLENILDKNYQEERGYPGEGFNFIINLEVEIF